MTQGFIPKTGHQLIEVRRFRKAIKLLGLPLDATAWEVKQRTKQVVQQMHPDNGGEGGDLSVFTDARDTIIKYLEKHND